MNSDTEDDRDDDMIYTSRIRSSARPGSSSSQSLRSRIFGLASAHAPSRVRDKPICTTPGVLCAGETETETDEPSRHLPTARIIPSSGPLVPPNTLEQRLTPLLFEFSRLLSIVPAIFGTLYNLYHIYRPPTYDSAPNTRPPPERVDYFISALWAILTGYQCLSLATGLLTRWRLYYPPLSTLVRLLALQGICWPATHLTLTILEHEKRPAITWAVIGTTTCMSRSVQIWVTSNLWWEKREAKERGDRDLPAHGHGLRDAAATEENRRGYWKRWGGGGKWGGRRWDWKEVGVKCVLPAGIVYFVMAWAEQLRREWAISAC
ncbi:N-glycosylation protein-domain-containing protein [Flammula alnicola]|nr:N-glycosylation protein-domain-containing protein [Flammula alnicola]